MGGGSAYPTSAIKPVIILGDPQIFSAVLLISHSSKPVIIPCAMPDQPL